MSSAPFPPPYGMPPPPIAYADVSYQAPLPIPVVPIDANGRIAADLRCRKCSYNLRGLAMEGRCPECGRAIGLPVMGDLLRYSDPNWIATLRRGLNLILWAIFVVIGLFIFGMVMGATGNAAVVSSRGVTSILSGVLYQALFFLGAWLLTVPDPSGIGEDIYGTSRKVIRVALLVGIAQPVVNVLSQEASPEMMIGLVALNLVIGIVSLVGQMAQLQYLHKLAQRIPDPRLSDRARFLLWSIGISYGVMLVFGFIAALLMRTAKGGPAAVTRNAAFISVGCVAGVAMLAMAVFGITYLLMLGRFRKALGQQEGFARQTWAAQPLEAAPLPS